MLRTQSQRSHVEPDPEMEGMVEAELARLQRQYRIMEGDRKAYYEEIQNVLRKQRKAIEELEKEKNEITTSLQLAQSSQNENKDLQNTALLCDLLEKQEKHKADTDAEKQEINELEQQIRRVEHQIAHQRKQLASVRSSSVNVVNSKKKIRVLENRLDNVTGNFNEMLAHNASMRREIDHLLKEKSRFNALHSNLSRRLAAGKQAITELIEHATQAYDQRDEAHTKMQVFKERSEKDAYQHSLEVKELQRTLDHEQKLKDFFSKKGQDRASVEEMVKQTKEKSHHREKAGEKSHEETLESYMSIFTHIQEATGEEDIDKLVSDFIRIEDQNFTLFNYVNELNNEVEALQEQIQGLQLDIQENKAQGLQREAERQNHLKDLQEKVESSATEAQKSEAKLEGCEETLTKLREGIGKLFQLSQCDSSPVLELLGNSTDITNSNILMYLNILEQRTNELLNIMHYTEHQKQLEEGIPSTPKTPGGPFTNNTQTGSIQNHNSWNTLGLKKTLVNPGDESDYGFEAADEMLIPLSPVELKTRALQESPKPDKSDNTQTPTGTKEIMKVKGKYLS